ncbi:MAG: glycerophosphoryl diester phosphodiesterase [Gammaproteobacteria bacterium]|nr:glycerophosphoryl diester phosphodiesterase [Gammaproteobacteria bacterium]
MKIEPLIIHRGASPYAPENTIAAFDKALEFGARAIEFDVMMSVDGELFVFHDKTLERTTNGRGEFGSTSSEYISALDAGTWFSNRYQGEKVPSLSDTLFWLIEYQIQANIEIKPLPGLAEATTKAVLACLNRHWPSTMQLPLVSCFDEDALRLCAHLSPDLPLGVLFHKWQKNWIGLAKEVNAVSVHLNKYAVTRKRIKAIKEAGYKACAYTVNSREWASRYFSWGADSILSDYPDLMGE